MKKYKPWHITVNNSMMKWGIDVPKMYMEDFTNGKPLKKGESRDLEVSWGNNNKGKKYRAKLINYKNSVPQIRWETDRDLLNKVRTTFIHSYLTLLSQKEEHQNKKGKKRFRTNLKGGEKEVLIIEPLGNKKIKMKEFIVIEHNWAIVFKKLVESNIFGWLFEKQEKGAISKSSSWIHVKDFAKHANTANVIYYLLHPKKLLYIGKATHLGERIKKPGKKHQDMPAGWYKFRYDIIKPEFSKMLTKIEDHTIKAFARILKNKTKLSGLGIGSYTLVNKQLLK